MPRNFVQAGIWPQGKSIAWARKYMLHTSVINEVN
jgi:hypothetical protein